MKTALLNVTSRRKPADLFVIGSFEKDRLPKEIHSLESEFARTFQKVASMDHFSGKVGESFALFHDSNHEASEVVILGLGAKKDYATLGLRKVVGQVSKLAKARKAKTVRILLDSFCHGDVKPATAAGTFGEIWLLAAYEFNRYKSPDPNAKKNGKEDTLEFLTLKKQNSAALEKSVKDGLSVARGIMLTRDLINEPANVMTPNALAARAKKLALEKKFICKVIGPAELKKLKMGGILGVGSGSINPPALIVLEYGQRYKSKGTFCVVGKGVTFDTGGISIKPAKDMDKMKYDMSGAAAVIGIMGVISDLKIPVHVVGLAPTAENNVSEDPQRPGDIVHMHNGKTVEVLNTDAEGRLILADALSYAAKFKPKAIIDMATLTGLVVYTFGDKAIGLMTNDEKFAARVKKAGEQTGERCWELPMWDDYREMIKGNHADLNNIGGPHGGTITAAKFLQEFVPEKTPWVHLDIAGTAWCDVPRYDCPKGATGVGVRLVTKLLSDWK
ncbi:MAG: leucyl aminopeptidase [Candidatus Omnitrophota bacterium]|nr:leucyl aminopeptidase [Candidatus Omnitrophota bacterium]